MLHALGAKGRSIYREINIVDFILAPIVFREYLLNTFPATTPKRDTVREALANTYFLGDLLENVSVSIMLKTYPQMIDIVAWLGCAGNLVKTFGICAAILAVLYEIYMWVRRTKVKTQ